MEGTRYRIAFARAVIVSLVTIVIVACVSACASAPPGPATTPIPTLGPFTSSAGAATLAPDATDSELATPATSSDIPDTPVTTKATTLTRPLRGSSAPEGAVVFGSDLSESARAVNLTGERTTFAAGHQIAWRVTLPAATGGESVRVTLTDTGNSETQVDEFVAQPGWNVYYGKSLLTVAPGTYVLHYLVDSHEVGSGTFKIKPADVPVPAPTAAATPEPSAA